jgi:rhodanese-related sulfurtransferase
MSLTVKIIEPKEVHKKVVELEEQFIIIDVRQKDEFVGELGHIKTAQLVTLGVELTQFLDKGDRQQSIIFICRSGKRSENATLEALKLGYQQVYNMYGGMLAWNELNLPVEKK